MKVFVMDCLQEKVKAFRLRHRNVAFEFEFLDPVHSVYSEFNRVLVEHGPNGPFCVVHESVTLPDLFAERVADLVAILNRDWPNWGLVGNAGVTPLMYGLLASRRIRYFFDELLGPNLSGHVLPAENVFENVLLVNGNELLDHSFELPELPDRHLFSLVASVEALRGNRAVLLAPHLACYRKDSVSTGPGFPIEVTDACGEHLSKIISNTAVEILEGALDLERWSDAYWQESRFDTFLQSLRCAQVGRPQAGVAIVSRTRFERPGLLSRADNSIAAFANAAIHIEIERIVISGRAQPADLRLTPGASVVEIDTSDAEDDRSQLITEAARIARNEYLWFIDDDDWLFPNEAEALSLMFSVSPPGSCFFIDTMTFEEFGIGGDDRDAVPTSVSPMRKYPADQFASSIRGQNFTPFCGLVFPKGLCNQVPENLLARITLFEDYALILTALVSADFFPVAINVLGAGVSLRIEDQSVTASNRDAWNRSIAEVGASLARSARMGALWSLGPVIRDIPAGRDLRSSLDRSAHPLGDEPVGILPVCDMDPKPEEDVSLEVVVAAGAARRAGVVRAIVRRIPPLRFALRSIRKIFRSSR